MIQSLISRYSSRFSPLATMSNHFRLRVRRSTRPVEPDGEPKGLHRQMRQEASVSISRDPHFGQVVVMAVGELYP